MYYYFDENIKSNARYVHSKGSKKKKKAVNNFPIESVIAPVKNSLPHPVSMT
ncbi:hypothetical protein [Candidatus Lokiarchaeum ossiferum]|uniref:hypothetical protein n=1 Tax=Candidatus Lokiarchaeum ossiferum TaxID=2951803 RepID=UPI00352F4033